MDRLLLLVVDDEDEYFVEDRNRSRRDWNEYSDSGAEMMESQIIDWDWEVVSVVSSEEEEEGYEART